MLISSDKNAQNGAIMDVMGLVNGGESRKVEFKEKILKNLDSVIKTAIAFSNSGGGHIIIGIEDKTKKIVGISEIDQQTLPDRISTSLFDSIEPKVNFEIEHYTINNKSLLVVEVFPGNLTPYYLASRGRQDGTYVRVGATTRLADFDIIAELERQKRNISFDQEIAREHKLEDLDLSIVTSHFKNHLHRKIKKEDFLNLNLIMNENKKTQPTVGGVLICGKVPLHDNCFISCASFKGSSAEIFIDKKEFHGPIIDQIEKSMDFLKQHIPLKGKITGLKRQDNYEIPLTILREALVNCVVHRDYSIKGSHIKIAIFEDRIEFISPGALPKSIDVKDITFGRSEVRNKVVARFLKELGYIEQWGTGIHKMIELSKKENLRPPEFQESGLFFKVKIFRSHNATADIEQTEQERLILDYLGENKFIKNAQAQKILSVSASRARVIFEKMVSKNLLISSGEGKARIYKIAKA